MVLPVGTMSRLRTGCAWCVDTWHHWPKLFRRGADPDLDGDHGSICHRKRNGDRNANHNPDSDCDHKSIYHCNRDGDRDRNCDANRDGDGQRRSDSDGDAEGRIYGGGIFDAGGSRGQSVRAQHRQ